MVIILSTPTGFGMVSNSRALQDQLMEDMEMIGNMSPFLLGMGRSKRFSSTSTADSTHVFVLDLRVKGNDQFCTLEKSLTGLTMLNVMGDARFTSLSDTVALGLSTIAREAAGTGMTSGPDLRDVQPQPLRPGETIDGIQRPSSDVCSEPKCEGPPFRLLTESGCWQNNA